MSGEVAGTALPSVPPLLKAHASMEDTIKVEQAAMEAATRSWQSAAELFVKYIYEVVPDLSSSAC
jgi:hypothetical protein